MFERAHTVPTGRPERWLNSPPGASRYLQDGRCHACGAAAGTGPPPGLQLRKCLRCGVARYCSRACPAQDWPAHKLVCRELANWRQQLEALKADVAQASRAPTGP
ncbi:hypothetical protein ABPG75_000986 [Micractinium tetrahymenae]